MSAPPKYDGRPKKRGKPLDPAHPTVSLPPIRLPLNLRDLVEKGAEDRGVGVAEAVRAALWKEFGPSANPSTATE